MYLDRQTPPKTLDQSHFQRRGVVNHVSGLKRKGCPGTLNLAPALRACDSSRHNHCFPRLARLLRNVFWALSVKSSVLGHRTRSSSVFAVEGDALDVGAWNR